MDTRFQVILSHVTDRFANHLGDRPKSAFVKGSVARGDAIWGVSDIDFVLVFADEHNITSLKKLWKEICKQKVQEAYKEYMKRSGIES